MVFSSITFLLAFLPVVFLAYTLLPSLAMKNVFLVVVSLLFYAYGEPIYVLLMIFSVLMNYTFGRLINIHKMAKPTMIIAVVMNIGMLGVFKYADFLVENLNYLFPLKLTKPGIALPIGISFFTFQALSYVVDVYRQEVKAQKNFGKLLLYISFFPQLIAGPIVKYHDIEAEISKRKQTPDGIAKGIRRFIIGLSKKVLIANTLASAADYVFGLDASGLNIYSAWLGAIAYALQIYFDFSGYSDMALGLGEMFGFHFMENFHYPYYANSIKDFWHRWHISLSTWFKEYLYIPLGGNRKGKIRTSIHKLTVFFATGLWHGASWNFVLWSMIHGAFLILEDTILPLQKCRLRWLRQLYVMLIVITTFVIFRAENLNDAGLIIKNMFAGVNFTAESMSNVISILNPFFLMALIFGILFSFPVKEKMEKFQWLERISYGVSLLLLLACIFQLSAAFYNPFIYFRF
jgi:alginate O-acetyltransferase complex protein AlgI